MTAAPLLSVRNLSKTYTRRRWWGADKTAPAALHNVSFTLDAGRTLAVVGPSGSGKTTLARCLASFEKPSSGEIVFQGAAQEIQLIFQQPAASLNPRFTAAQAIEEPLLIQRRAAGDAVMRALDQVGLPQASLHKRCDQFSGGEKQRLAIARALVLEPKLIILDESLTGLDVTLQSQIVDLLRTLQAATNFACILISHDLGLAADFASEIAVMDRGALIEHAPAAALFDHPSQPLTRELLAATRALTL
jgi:ABC-type dipeptide/oligopeptide/nickel transport system ATPase subunit